MQQLPRQYRAPEIYGDYWFNSEPIPIHAHRGYSILIHFWDYSNTGSLRTLPYVQEWYKRYAKRGLVVIGVHSPEFGFAKDPVQVRQAIERLKITHPVVMDNSQLIWGAFRNRLWPACYLIDKDGFIRIIQEGEGSYQDFEHSIQSSLNEAQYQTDLPLVMEPLRETDKPGALLYKTTPEIFGGYHRGRIGNVEGLVPEATGHFDDPGVYLEGRLYLDGDWTSGRDCVRLDETEGREGKAVIRYNAKEVNAVAGSLGEKQFQVFVKQDDQYLTSESMGEDIALDSDARSFFLVNETRLYNIARNGEYGEHTLTFHTRSNGFALYSVSFVTAAVANVISFN